MRLSKRQLKRIIREEYARLQRRGLIRESQYTADGCLKANARGIVQIELPDFAGMSAESVRIQLAGSGEMEEVCYEALEDALAQCGGRVALPDMDGRQDIVQATAADFVPANTSGITEIGINRPGCKWKFKLGELNVIQSESRRRRRRSINEGRNRMGPEMMMDLEEFEDQLVMACGERYQRGELTDALENDMFEGDGIYSCEMVLGVCTDPQLKREIMRFCEMAVGEGGGDMYEPESDMY